MGADLGKVLTAARLRLHITQEALANRLGVSKAAIGQWERGASEPSTSNLLAVCRALGIAVNEAVMGRLVDAGEPNVAPMANTAAEIADPQTSMIPVFATAPGRSDELFTASDEAIHHIRRPPNARLGKAPYGIYASFSSLAPKYEPGDLMIVDPSRPPAARDYVVLRLDSQGGFGTFVAGRLVSRSSSEIEIELFNPLTLKKFATQNVEAIHRVVPLSDLIDG